jgi:DNA modification methylase
MKKIVDLDQRQLRLQLQFGNTEPNPLAQDLSAVALDSSFPTEEANVLAAREAFNKHLFRPNTYLHKWWARRSGTPFRYILKQLCSDPAKRDYYSPGGLEGKIILDPMMGGGTIIHEAIRLGACVAGYDIDPIPVLQVKAALTRIPLKEKRDVFKQFFDRLAERLSPFFATSCPNCGTDCESQFILYGLRKKCRCGEALFVDSLRLREEPDGTMIELCPYTGIPFAGKRPATSTGAKRSIYEKTVRQCPTCQCPFEELRNERFVERYVPLVIVGFCKTHGQFFKQPGDADLQRIEKARQFADTYVHLPIANLGVPGGPKSDDLLNKGIRSYADLFTHRQLIYIATCKELLDLVAERHRLWLGLLVSTSLEFNSLLCGFKGTDKRRPGAIRHVFSHHAYSFPYTALENNPVFSGNTSGTIGLLFQDRVQTASLWAEAPIERKPSAGDWKKITLLGETDWGIPVKSFTELHSNRKAFLVAQQDSSKLPLPSDSIDHVVTDPPYFDSVQYSDLAHFFRVWLRWLLPDEANWEYIVTDSAVAETAQHGLKYQKVLSAIWSECHRVLKKPTGRLVFTFHHWRPEAWTRLTLSLKNAGFRLVASYTVQSENPISVHIRQLKALKHDSILVLQPSESDAGRPHYSQPERIDTSDSYTFCCDCARLLGFCLESDLGETEIIQLWQKALGT